MIPTETELEEAILAATRSAVTELFACYPERFYYLTLFTTGEAHPPALSAWSVEALEREVARLGALHQSDDEVHPPARSAWSKEALEREWVRHEDREGLRAGIKWSYADSPYFAFGEAHFSTVATLFAMRPQWSMEMSDEEWETEYEVRLSAMERAMLRLDAEGVFGAGDDRNGIVVLVEVQPPDWTNTQRARRLNPPQALTEWLKEAAEDEPEG